MSFKLNKDNKADVQGHLADLVKLKKDLNAKIEEFNEALEAKGTAITEALEAFNEKLNDIESWRDDFTGELQSLFDEKSERWQDSDAGYAAQDFIDSWQNLSLDAVELELPEPFEPMEFDVIEELQETSGIYVKS